MWWQDAVVYQIYVRSFQDSNGDGIGDLPGVIRRLDYIARLGVDAIWLSPIYPSPNADYGYDVSDFTAVEPAFGDLDDLDRLIDEAHRRNLKVLLDFVPCHTALAHPWFRERPEFYFWADEPVNNWRGAFGGSAWSLDEQTGRYYLHSFYPEQADLNWRDPDVREEMCKALRFWLGRGVDGFRLDAIDRLLKDRDLRDDPPATTPFPLPLDPEYGELEHIHSRNAPDIAVALNAVRDAVGDAFLVGEAYVPTSQLEPYLDTLDAAFAFEPMHAGPDAERLEATITTAYATGKIGWVFSNHDFERFASRFGDASRAATVLFLMLPGPVFLYEGDELGVPNGPGANPPLDRAGRDRFRHPMPWDASANGGFTDGTPWLPPVPRAGQDADAQERDPHSTLSLFRRLIGLRKELPREFSFGASPPGTIVLERGDHIVAINLGEQRTTLDSQLDNRAAALVLEAHPGDGGDLCALPPHGGWIARR